MTRVKVHEFYVDDVSDEYLMFKKLDSLVKEPIPEYGRLVVCIYIEERDTTNKGDPK